ncbi:MAG: OmpA family protein [Ilumatobacteraceae bacterium]
MSEWDDNEDDDDDGDGQARSRRPIVIGAIAVLVLALVGVFAYRAVSGNDSTGASASSGPTSTAAVAATTTGGSTVTSASGTTGTAATIASGTTAAASAAPTNASTTAGSAVTSTLADTTTAAPVPDTAAARTTVAPPPVTDAATTVPATLASVTYDTLPDGNPAPIIVVYGADLITISGNVPDQASKDKLQGLAIANARTPVPVNNQLVIDPTVPRTIGVRVVELTSARFDEGSSKVAGAHAKELDRITAIMNALPNITVLIVGHADQIGSTDANYQLSLQRANAVVAYLVQSGISPQRLSSRAVGDTDLLTLNDDAASLALNRRTEFIIYGLVNA